MGGNRVTMKYYVVEEQFKHLGLDCVVVMQSAGHRCGYVGLQRDHPLYGKDYTNYLDITKDEIADKEIRGTFALLGAILDKDKRVKIEAYFDVHGGITYADGGRGSTYPIESDRWWFGFDCAHFDDAPDFDSARKLFAGNKDDLQQLDNFEKASSMFPSHSCSVRSLDYVCKECISLAEQLYGYTRVVRKKDPCAW